ncbi:hypothetical protein C5E10_11620 [Pseudoclavibacter sp. RFBG4]|uniref:hypothetical protein n=1 Tax=Pseudoclavibacter sp. RFBG4 TaxID=2080575 RepID=UPI000CE8D11E|nr:hypothetical protein [Pseudoclavibacter sp. RFBG4]PPG30778.1 hypothetical protein C5E10_11620 [Pseudoclavibacter sp. RFBG4]
MTRTNRTAANQLRKLDQQWAAEDHQAVVAWFMGNPDMAARELPELEELVTAATESGHPPAAALLGLAVLVTDTTIRIADAATLDPVTGRLDRAAVEGYLAALDLWIGPPLDKADRKSARRTRDMFGNEIGRAHHIER